VKKESPGTTEEVQTESTDKGAAGQQETEKVGAEKVETEGGTEQQQTAIKAGEEDKEKYVFLTFFSLKYNH